MRRLALPCLLVLACAPVEPGSTSHLQQPIFGGQPVPSEDAVFFVDDDAGSCSATLIAPRTLLLAAHCVETGVAMTAQNLPRASADAGVYVIVKRETYADANDGGTVDLALVLLDRAPPIAPRGWVWWNPAPTVGSSVRHVGYGRSELGPPGERRSVTTVVTGATEARAYGMVLLTGNVGQGLCFGDSGGPAFISTPSGERVAAVHSFITTACGAGVSSSVLLYPYRRFIERWLAANEPPQCARDGRCVSGCQPEDPDCACGADGQCGAGCPPGDDPDCPNTCSVDGVCASRGECPVDNDCVPDGEFCLAASQCAGRVCVSDAQNPSRYCSQRCDAQSPCPATMSCDAARGVCQLRQLPSVVEGESCESALVRCAPGLACMDLGPDRRCFRTCTSQAQCPEGTRCQFQREGACLPLPPLRVPAGATWEGPLSPVGCAAGPGLFAPALLTALAVLRRPRRRAERPGGQG